MTTKISGLDTPKKYHPFLRILHWLMALLIISQIFLGWYMEYSEDAMGGKDAPAHVFLYDLHKSLGVTLLLLVAIRIIIRVATFIPPYPKTIHPVLRGAAKVSHYALYALMVITPLAGYAMSDSLGKGVKLFGLPLPKILPDDKTLGATLGELHDISAYTLLALIVIHIAAALRHHFFDKPGNDTLRRIL